MNRMSVDRFRPVTRDRISVPGARISPRVNGPDPGPGTAASGSGLACLGGCATVQVYRPLQVAVLSTGDELVEPGALNCAVASSTTPIATPWRAWCASLGMSSSMAASSRTTRRLPPGHCRTPPPGRLCHHLRRCLGRRGRSRQEPGGAPGAVGPVEAGDQAWQAAGFRAHWRHAFIGLPGNPTSVFVTFCLIARPFLLKLQGVDEPSRPRCRQRQFAVDKPGGRQEYLRVTLESTRRACRRNGSTTRVPGCSVRSATAMPWR